MTQACLQFAQTWLSTDPNSGIPQMTLQQGVDGITSAATMARTAVELDPSTWTEGERALTALANGMKETNSPKVKVALARVRKVCNPLIQQVDTTTTSTP